MVVVDEDEVESGVGPESDHPDALERLLRFALMGTSASVDSAHMVGVRIGSDMDGRARYAPSCGCRCGSGSRRCGGRAEIGRAHV